MALQLVINVDDPGDILTGYGAGAKLILERDTSPAFNAPTEVGSIPITAEQSQYEQWDASGEPTHWYRSRYSDAVGANFSAYSDPFQGGEVRAYASVDSLRELLQLPDDSRDNLISDLLRRVTDKINLSLGFDFFRHPQVEGTETRYFDGGGSEVISLQQGFLEVTGITVASGTGATPVALDPTHHYLRSPVQNGGPYLELVLSDIAPHTHWYRGHRTVAVTGVFGYPSVPPAIEMATLYWAADLYRIGAYGGSQFGPGLGGSTGMSAGLEEFGQPRFAGGMPRITWETVEDYRRRHKTWLAV